MLRVGVGLSTERDSGRAAAGAAASSGATTGAAVGACAKAIKITSSAFQGWTAERSRCDNRSRKMRARLGPDRKLETECL